VLSPKLSSLWLYFVTSTSYSLARTLVASMKNEVICSDTVIQHVVPVNILGYSEALQLAFEQGSEKNSVPGSSGDISQYTSQNGLLHNPEVPEHGVLIDKRIIAFEETRSEVLENLWRIGGNRGWYFGNWMWRTRGALDKVVGGVGLRRGRRSEVDLRPGDALDFWRVLIADKETGRLLLYAEMKLPGEAWLEFRIKESNGQYALHQTATFQPLGLWGRVYWYLMLPFHVLLFPRMARNIVNNKFRD
jgi:hypothetical protein